MNRWIKFTIIHFIFAVFTTTLYADVGGTVFRDVPVNGTALNTYGVKQSNELGVEGVTVTAYYNSTSSSTTTDVNGAWSIATSGDVRVEFSAWPIYLNESPDGGGNIAVQFVSDGDTGVDFALHEPSDYSNTTEPYYILNRQQTGTSTNNSEPGVEAVHYADSNLSSDFCNEAGDQGIGPVPTVSAEVKDVGSSWGQAFQKDKQRLFLAAALRRHTGLTSVGAGRVSVLDYSAGVGSVTNSYIDLQGVTPANSSVDINLGSVCRDTSCKDDTGNTGIAADYVLPDNVSDPSVDLDAYGKVGKMSFGDIDFDQTSNTLWLVNLYQKGIISVDASGDLSNLSTATKQYLIEDMTNAPSCTNGELRPWALTIHNARGYLGAVCDESDVADDVNEDNKTSSNSRAFVLSFDLSDPTTGFNVELDMDLSYKNGDDIFYTWKTWSDDYSRVKKRNGWFYEYNQAILGDIEFDENNVMYMAFLNRYAMQSSFENYHPLSGNTDASENVLATADLLRACYESNSTYSLEGTGTCTDDNYDGYFLYDRGGDGTKDYSGGALALLKGSDQLLHVTTDPAPVGASASKYYSTAGVNTLSMTDGGVDNWYSIMYTNPQDGDDCDSGKSHSGYNAKGSSLGDIELITAPTPVEIGNRVWIDANNDGVQSPDESGISDVDIELYSADGSTLIATAETDSNGYYIFSNNPDGTDTTSAKYNLTSLQPNVAYIVKLPNADGASKQSELGDYILTYNNIGEGTNSNANDSDGILKNNDANITVLASEIAYSGANNHSFDFGFREDTIDYVFTKISETNSTTAAVQEGDIIDYNITFSNESLNTLTDVQITDPIPIGTTYENGTGQIIYYSVSREYHTIADNMTVVGNPASYQQNDGDVNWDTNWTETGENGNPGNGRLRIVDSGGTGSSDGDAASIRLTDTDRYLEREVDLSEYTEANLTFRYKKEADTDATHAEFKLIVSDDESCEISDTYVIDSDDGTYYDSVTYDITDCISQTGNTVIRLSQGAVNDNGDYFYIDDLKINVVKETVALVTEAVNIETELADNRYTSYPNTDINVSFSVKVGSNACGLIDVNNTATVNATEINEMSASAVERKNAMVVGIPDVSTEENLTAIHIVNLSYETLEERTFAFSIEHNTTDSRDFRIPEDISFTNGVTLHYDEATDSYYITVPAGVTAFEVHIQTYANDVEGDDDREYKIIIDCKDGKGILTDANTVPVTISYAHPQLNGNSLDLEFGTASETMNVGFNIYAIKGKSWIKLNTELIEGAFNSLVPKDYQVTVAIPEDITVNKIGIAGVDVNGEEDRHGAFKIGKMDGAKTKALPIDWNKISKRVKSYKKAKKAKIMKVSANSANEKVKFKNTIVDILVEENRVYRITHADLMEHGVNLKGIKANKIAISFKNRGVQRVIEELNDYGKWTQDSYLEFKGKKPNSTNNNKLYIKANRYQLSLKKKLAVESDYIEPVSTKELVFQNDVTYGWTSPGSDPFYDKLIYVYSEGQTATVKREFELTEVPNGEVKLKVVVGAYSNTQHNIQVSLNGSQIADHHSSSGWMDMPIKVTVDGSDLNEGTNTISITAVGGSTEFDVYTYDKLVLSYDTDELASLTPTISLRDKMTRGSIKPEKGDRLLVIAHPMFMTDALNDYIEQKESQGWKTHLVSVEDIYNAYGYGMETPNAINFYLQMAERKGITHVQLVGSATYDYLDKLGLGSVNFIGSIYTKTGEVTRYTPCDGCLVDDETGIPQMAIGRWAVRTEAELETVINKSLDWQNNGQSQTRTALLMADKKDEYNNLDFTNQMKTLSSEFNTFNSVTKVYFDDYITQNAGDESAALQASREAIQESLNSGATITTYSGHSSLSKWSYKGLLKQDDIVNLTNENKTTIALPLACYTTYADSPHTKTLAHQFVAGSNGGAVAVYGASTLSSFTDNAVSSKSMIQYLLSGETIGEAVRKSKVDLGSNYMDVIKNSNLLGDVTLRFD